MRIAHAVTAKRAADDVVGEHGFDVHVVLFRFFGKVRCAEQALLFTRHRHEDNRRVEFVFRHHPRHLQYGRRS